jgi:ribosomal protein S18 acetylase RimI-like enzyme
MNNRLAIPDDIPACLVLRGQTRESAISAERLAAMGITAESWASDVRSGSLTGFVWLENDIIVGFCFGDNANGEVVVLAVLPDFERRGIGAHLLSLVVKHLSDTGYKRLFLGCSADAAKRAHGFYRSLGWASTGTYDHSGDEVLELYPVRS